MRRSSRLELGVLEARTLNIALALSRADPDVLVLVHELAECTLRSETAVMRDVLLLESQGLLEFTAAADGVYVTEEACRWAAVLQANQEAVGTALN